MRDVLQAKGYRTVETETAEEGLRVALDQRPALILMDIQLPGINGIEALKRLRADPATRAIPVIAVTASAMQQNRKDDPRGRLRRLPAQADQRQRVFESGARNTGWAPGRARRLATATRTTAARILVVDDTPRNVKLLADLLAREGLRGRSPPHRAPRRSSRSTRAQPDLVLLDVVMPGMSGYEVCRRIRDDPAGTRCCRW